MPEIRSSIGSRPVRGASKFSVPDESAEDFDMSSAEGRMRAVQAQQEAEDGVAFRSMDEIAAARQGFAQKASRVSPNAKRRIEMLVGIGRANKDIVVESENGNMTLSLRTLKGSEMKALANLTAQAAQAGNAAAVFDIRNVTLAFVIDKIDGVDIDVVLDCVNSPDNYDVRKTEFLDQLDDTVLNYLYREYQNLSKENQRKFGINSEAEAKEVVSDMTKSGQRT